MRVSRALMLLLLAALPLAACGKGKACDKCDNVDDCESGLTCQQFFDSTGNIQNLCGDANPFMTCPAS